MLAPGVPAAGPRGRLRRRPIRLATTTLQPVPIRADVPGLAPPRTAPGDLPAPVLPRPTIRAVPPRDNPSRTRPPLPGSVRQAISCLAFPMRSDIPFRAQPCATALTVPHPRPFRPYRQASPRLGEPADNPALLIATLTMPTLLTAPDHLTSRARATCLPEPARPPTRHSLSSQGHPSRHAGPPPPVPIPDRPAKPSSPLAIPLDAPCLARSDRQPTPSPSVPLRQAKPCPTESTPIRQIRPGPCLTRPTGQARAHRPRPGSCIALYHLVPSMYRPRRRGRNRKASP